MVDLSTADPLLGELLDGRYRVDSRIASGGMATVYTGFDTRLDRAVAIKVMHGALTHDEDFVERFRGEAKSAARLSHPNVVAIFDQGEDGGRVYLVMEYVAGATLRELLRAEGPLEPDRALAILEGVLAALAAAHDAGMVHRDVKPENVLLTPDGLVKVADFGLARAIEASHYSIVDGTLIGTVAYLAPEQVESGAADARTDLYAAGVVLFEMLTGGPPFTGDTPIAVAYRHVNEDVPPPSQSRPGLPRAVDALVAAATHREPDERYADARAMSSVVRRTRAGLGGTDTAVIPMGDAPTVITRLPVAGEPVAPPPVAPPPQPKVDRRRRRPSKKLVLALVVALLLGSAAAAGWFFGTEHSVDVPTFTGLTAAQAEQAALDNHLTLHTGPAVFSEDVPRGQVAAQDPGPGESVGRNTVVTIQLSKGKERLPVPDVRGKSLAVATSTLRQARLALGTVNRQFSTEVEKDLVISMSQDPSRARVKPGTKVDLVVSNGPQPVDVVDVRGKPRKDAVATLQALGLKVSVTEEYDEKVEAGLVVSQDPKGGTTVFAGTTVTLVVSKGPPVVVVPDVVGESRADAARMLESRGLDVKFVDFPGRRGRRVVDQDPAGGTTVRKGSTVTLYMAS